MDWAIVDYERLSKSLIQRGVIDKNASEKEFHKAVEEYAAKNSVPNGIDTSTAFSKKAKKGLKGVQRRGAKKANEKYKKLNPNKAHKDMIAAALIEFPDYKHNRIQPEEGYLYTKDFNPDHYRNMLFNQKGYTTPEGLKLTTMAQYYLQQSGGTWTVDGVVTPWMQSKRTAAENDKDPRPG